MADSAMVSAIFVHKKIENFHPRFLSDFFYSPFFYDVKYRKIPHKYCFAYRFLLLIHI